MNQNTRYKGVYPRFPDADGEAGFDVDSPGRTAGLELRALRQAGL